LRAVPHDRRACGCPEGAGGAVRACDSIPVGARGAGSGGADGCACCRGRCAWSTVQTRPIPWPVLA
jgi:hypothetical protein